MVLEESLVFYSEDDAGTFISYLRKKGCKAHKKPVTVFFEHETITGTIDKVLGWLSKHIPGNDQPSGAGSDNEVLENTRRRIEAQKIALDTLFTRYREGDRVYTKSDLIRFTGVLISHAAHAISPLIQGKIAELGNEIPYHKEHPGSPADDTIVAMRSLETWNVLWENHLVEERGDDFHLIKKVPAGDCSVQVNTQDFPNFDQEDITGGGLVLHIHMVGDVRYQVFMDSGIHFHLTEEEVKEALKGLDVEDESLDNFTSSMEMKDLAIHAILEVIRDTKRISLEKIGDRMREYPVHAQDSQEVITLTFEHEFLDELVTEMKKAGILAGSDENIHIR